jgi:hypothetical protein
VGWFLEKFLIILWGGRFGFGKGAFARGLATDTEGAEIWPDVLEMGSFLGVV